MAAVYVLSFGLALAAGSTLVEGGPTVQTRRLELLCLGLLGAALLSAGIGFSQWAGVQNLGIFGADVAPGQRPFANFGQPNHWCTASVIGLGASWMLFEARRISGPTLALVAAMLLGAIVVSGSRTGGLQLLLAVALVLGMKRRTSMRLPIAAVVVAVMATAVAWLLWTHLNTEAATGAARSLESQAQAGIRLPLWSALIDAILQRPWLGYGWQQMVMAQQAVALEGPPLHVHFEHAHNLVLDMLLWVGLPLGCVLLGLAGWPLLQLLAQTRDPRVPGLLLAAGGVLVHSMLEYPIEYAYFLLPLGLVLGAAHKLTGSPALKLPVPFTRGMGVVFVMALVLTATDYVKAEQAYRMFRLESARIGTARIESPPPDLRLLSQLEAFLRFAALEPRAGLSAEQIEFSGRVAARFAIPLTQLRHAQVLALNQDPQGAALQLRVLCAMHSIGRCSSAVERWLALQSEQPALRAVPPPPLPR
jgi:O-antigen ligase